MGGDTSTTTNTSSTAPSNPDVNPTVSQLLKGVQSAYSAGPQTFDKSLYAGVGPTTQNAWASSLGAAGNPDYASGVGGAIKSFGDIASGGQMGQLDPQYQQVRQKAIDDAITNVGQGFTQSGRYGGGSYIDTATNAAGNVAANMDLSRLSSDEARQQQAAALLPQLYGAAQLPSATQGAVGSAQDANSQATLQGQYDLNQRSGQNANINLLAQLSSILNGTAGQGGQTTTSSQTSPSTPWWQSGISLVGSLL